MKFNLDGLSESCLEGYLRAEVKKVRGLSYKFVSPGNPGVPDRIVILGGRVFFVELKTATGKLGNKQKAVRTALEGQGMEYRVVRSREDVRGLISEVCTT